MLDTNFHIHTANRAIHRPFIFNFPNVFFITFSHTLLTTEETQLNMSDNAKTQGQTFPLFPKLPKEIRLMIWELTLPGPRTVHLQQRKLKTTIGEWEDQSGLSWPLFPEVHEIRGENGEPNSRQRRYHRWAMRSKIQRALGMPSPSKKSSIYREASLLGLHSQSLPLETPALFVERHTNSRGISGCFQPRVPWQKRGLTLRSTLSTSSSIISGCIIF